MFLNLQFGQQVMDFINYCSIFAVRNFNGNKSCFNIETVS